jgi:hypothetical protein
MIELLFGWVCLFDDLVLTPVIIADFHPGDISVSRSSGGGIQNIEDRIQNLGENQADFNAEAQEVERHQRKIFQAFVTVKIIKPYAVGSASTSRVLQLTLTASSLPLTLPRREDFESLAGFTGFYPAFRCCLP